MHGLVRRGRLKTRSAGLKRPVKNLVLQQAPRFTRAARHHVDLDALNRPRAISLWEILREEHNEQSKRIVTGRVAYA